MKQICKILLVLFLMLSCVSAYAESSYDVKELYSLIKPAAGTKAVGKYDKTIEVEYILTPTKVDKGKYVIEVKKIGDNLYQVKNTDLCIETRYCHEYASFSEEVILIIESNYGFNKGKIIFD